MSTTTVLNQAKAANTGLLEAARDGYMLLSDPDKTAVRTAVLDPANAALYGWLQSTTNAFINNIFPAP